MKIKLQFHGIGQTTAGKVSISKWIAVDPHHSQVQVQVPKRDGKR